MPATGVWARAGGVRNSPPPTTMTLIHRDDHPENTVWSASRLTGVVDWTQASCGPPALDVAHMRWNLAADHGRKVADQFLDCYRATTGRRLEHHAYWDLVSLLDLLFDGEDPDEPRRVRTAAAAQALRDHTAHGSGVSVLGRNRRIGDAVCAVLGGAAEAG